MHPSLSFSLYTLCSLCWYACAQNPCLEVVSVGECHACVAVDKEANCDSMVALDALCPTIVFCGRSAHT